MTAPKLPPRAGHPSLSSSMNEAALLASEGGAFAFYRWDDIAINVWTSQPTAQGIKVLAQLTERSLSECPSGLSSIHWLDQGVGLPTPEARYGLAEIAKRYGSHLVCVGVLLQGSGFWASATRSALTGIMLLAPRPFSLRFFGDSAQLAAFIVRERAQRARKITDAAQLAQVVERAVHAFAPTSARA